MKHQNRDINSFQIFIEIGFRKRLDALIMSNNSARHSLPPPVSLDTFFYICTFPVISVERNRQIDIKLLSIVQCLVSDTIKNGHRNTIWIAITLHHNWWNRTDQNCFFSSTFSIFINITNYFAPTCRMPDVNNIFQVKKFYQLSSISSVSFDVMPVNILTRAAVTSSIMRNYPITSL
ncbi:hypothetical protein D3C86_1406940 [compost metagenome]